MREPVDLFTGPAAQPDASARKLTAPVVPVVLATDYNPGTHPAGGMPLVRAIACVG